jgi:hypothetical protein
MPDDMTTPMPGAPEGTEADTADQEGEVLEVVAMHATTTAIGSVSAEEFDASQCAIGSASVEGDASVEASIVGVLSASSAGVHQGGAAVMVVDGDVSIDQGGAQVIVAQSAGIEQGGVGVLVAGDASLARSWVGLMAARNATLSDDSRVIIDTRSALIIGGLLFGGLGFVGICMLVVGKRIASRVPHLPWNGHTRGGLMGGTHGGGDGRMAEMIRARMREMSAAGHGHDAHKMPDLPKIDLSKFDLPSIIETIAKLRHAG